MLTAQQAAERFRALETGLHLVMACPRTPNDFEMEVSRARDAGFDRMADPWRARTPPFRRS